jgi:hypothetical protein
VQNIATTPADQDADILLPYGTGGLKLRFTLSSKMKAKQSILKTNTPNSPFPKWKEGEI